MGCESEIDGWEVRRLGDGARAGDSVENDARSHGLQDGFSDGEIARLKRELLSCQEAWYASRSLLFKLSAWNNTLLYLSC